MKKEVMRCEKWWDKMRKKKKWDEISGTEKRRVEIKWNVASEKQDKTTLKKRRDEKEKRHETRIPQKT